MDADERYAYMNCFEDKTLMAEEQEFLFPVFSAFRFTKIKWNGGNCMIEVEVLLDNISEAFDGPVLVNVSLGPWS